MNHKIYNKFIMENSKSNNSKLPDNEEDESPSLLHDPNEEEHNFSEDDNDVGNEGEYDEEGEGEGESQEEHEGEEYAEDHEEYAFSEDNFSGRNESRRASNFEMVSQV